MTLRLFTSIHNMTASLMNMNKDDFHEYRNHAIHEWAKDRTDEGLDDLEMNKIWSTTLINNNFHKALRRQTIIFLNLSGIMIIRI